MAEAEDEGRDTLTRAYPQHWEADVVLRDGSTMHIRPIRPEDADALQRFHVAQSPESTYFRFFAPMARLADRDLIRFTHVDHHDRVALVLVSGEEIVAVGRFDRIDARDAEVAFNVADFAQGRGLGSVLLEHLAAAGHELGVRRFVADVLPNNTRMIRVFSDAGYDVSQHWDDGILSVSFTIRPTDRSLAVLHERERRAEALSMRALLGADSVLVVGSGAEGEGLATHVLHNIAASPFTGPVHSVTGPGGPAQVTGPAGLAQVTGPVDLAVVAAPAAEVLDLLPQLSVLGVHGVVLLTGGFTTTAQEGKVSQGTLVRTMRENGLRLVGPRSYGVLASGTSGQLNASLTRQPVHEGDIGVFCQSAAAARSLMAEVHARGLGLSSFLSAGHRVDVSGNDTMQFWTTEERTRVACVNLESIGNPRKFSRVARHLSESRPVIARIVGSTGQLRPPGHPVRPTRAPRRALDELMRQAGVLQVDSIAEQLDVATLLSEQPLPAGDRVLVLTNSGTQGAVLTELLRARGLRTAGDPIALSPVAGAGEYAAACTGAVERDDWAAAIVCYGPFLDDQTDAIAAEVARLAHASGRTTLAQLLGLHGLVPQLRHGATWVPAFATMEGAVAALDAAHRYATWRAGDRGEPVDPDGIDRRRAKDLVLSELAGIPPGTTHRLSRERTAELLATHGLSVWDATTVIDLDHALEAAERIGWPVALKTTDEILRHRADLGGVRLELSSAEELVDAHAQMVALLRGMGRHDVTFDVQAMAPTGAACVLRAVEDELYGPIVSFGLAGDAVELLGDVSFRVPPLTTVDVAQLVRSVKASPRLLGHRDLPVLDVAGLEDVIARVSVLKEELAEVASIVLNPVLVGQDAVAVLSATVDVAHPARGDAARRVLPG